LLKRLLIGAGVLLGLTLLVLVLFLALTDFSRYRSEIEVAITDATGREFKIAGEFKPIVFPLSLIAEDISLANAEWGSDSPFLTIGHVSTMVDLSSLFFGPLRIREFRLRDVDLLLEVNPDGDDNWSMLEDDTPREVETEVSDGIPAILDFAEIRNIIVTYRKAGADDRVITLASFDVQINENDYIEMEGLGKIDGSNLSVNGLVGPIDSFDSVPNMGATVTSDDVGEVLGLFDLPVDLAGPLRIESSLSSQNQQPVLKIDASAGDISAESSITIDNEQFDFEASVSPLSRVGEIVDIAGLPATPLTAKGSLIANSDHYELKDVLVELQTMQAEIDGQFGRSSGTLTEVTVAFSGDSLEEISADLPAIPVSGTVTAMITPERIKLDPFEIRFADSDVSGALDAQLVQPIAVSGIVHADLLDLTPFADGPEVATDGATPADSTVEPETDAEKFVFNEDPLDLGFLDAGSVDLKIDIDRVRQGPLELEDLRVSVILEDGALILESEFAVADGGDATAVVSLASAESSAKLDMNIDISDLRPSLGESDERSAADIPLFGLTADIQSFGESLRAIAANSSGKVLMTQGAGKVDNSAAGFISADIVAQLFDALNPFAKEERFSNWECTVFALDIVDGVAEISPMLAQGEKLTIVAEGNIDMNTEELHISFNTKPRRGVGVSADMFVTPFIRLGGTLAAPRMALDKKGVALSGGAAILTGGVSFILQGAADRASGATDRCDAALAIANGQSVETE